MSTAILRTQEQVWDAPRSQLDATHAALTGAAFPPHVADDAARVRLTMLILSAKDYSGPEEDPISAVLRKGIKMKNVYKPGTLAAELATQIPEETAPRTKVVAPTRRALKRVRAVGDGARMQKGSARYAVFLSIAAAGATGTTVAELDANSPFKTSGHVQKLAAAGHIEPVTEQSDDAE